MLIAGAGMAGLVCAARARELGLRPRLIEKGTRPGGSMLLSSCVVWRHLEWEDFRAECPAGDEELQRLIWERLDDALAWLVSLGAQPVWEDTENPRTTGKRFDPHALTQVLARDVELETPLPEDAEAPLVLATGGFPRRLAEERGLLLRANPWSDGAGLDYAAARGAGLTDGMAEFYGRVMPAPPAHIREEDFVPLSQLYGRWARIFTDDGREITPAGVAWHESDLAQRIGPTAWFVLDDAGLAHAQERVDAARAVGGTVVDAAALPFETPPGARTAVHVAAAVTHTMGGLRVDTCARVLAEDDRPIPGLYAAGVDAGGVATGGYASGLAQALVLGLAAAEELAG
ncbi:MAG: fumarate reductase/succinate dehydrogenase flavoprotein-like protein [Actinomycetia bacterium]|nr:fumarate reductase/succinate dehydrogenase flavoprotein-like protein [Actinomycetes bacterium]